MAKKQNSLNQLITLALLRLSLGFIFLWAFFDKLVGLGFSTCRETKTQAVDVMCSKAWLNGGSPTLGFLKFGTKGPFASTFQSLAGHAWVDWLFMAGLLLIGVALVFGIAMKLAVYSGSLMLGLMWLAALWPANNPFLDEHLIYIIALFILLAVGSDKWSLNSWWQKQSLVKKFPILK